MQKWGGFPAFPTSLYTGSIPTCRDRLLRRHSAFIGDANAPTGHFERDVDLAGTHFENDAGNVASDAAPRTDAGGNRDFEAFPLLARFRAVAPCSSSSLYRPAVSWINVSPQFAMHQPGDVADISCCYNQLVVQKAKIEYLRGNHDVAIQLPKVSRWKPCISRVRPQLRCDFECAIREIKVSSVDSNYKTI